MNKPVLIEYREYAAFEILDPQLCEIVSAARGLLPGPTTEGLDIGCDNGNSDCGNRVCYNDVCKNNTCINVPC